MHIGRGRSDSDLLALSGDGMRAVLGGESGVEGRGGEEDKQDEGSGARILPACQLQTAVDVINAPP